MNRVLASALLAAGVLPAAGCGGLPPTYPVRGRVVYADGSPAPVGTLIIFESTKPPYPRSMGAIGPGGAFALGTVRSDDGSLAGDHRVQLSPIVPDGVDDPKAYVARVCPARYLEFRTSGWAATVTPGGPNEFEFVIERAAGKR